MMELAIWLVTFVVLLVTFVIGVSVLKDIFEEGVERNRGQGEQKPSEPTEMTEKNSPEQAESATVYEKSPSGTNETDDLTCGNCNTTNNPVYTYCKECAGRL